MLTDKTALLSINRIMCDVNEVKFDQQIKHLSQNKSESIAITGHQHDRRAPPTVSQKGDWFTCKCIVTDYV